VRNVLTANSGKGTYDDGSESTPIKITRRVIEDQISPSQIALGFYDEKHSYVSELETAVNALPNFDRIKDSVVIGNSKTDDSISSWLAENDTIPILFFIDPWGYQSISLELISNSIRSFGCDCLFFFNYSRLNMGVSNDALMKPVEHFFGPDLYAKVRKRVETEGHGPHYRRAIIMEEIAAFFRSKSAYTRPFTFMKEGERRISHDLMLVTKHPIGIGVFKDIASKHCFLDPDGVPHFEFCDVNDSLFPVLSAGNVGMKALKVDLLGTYSGKVTTIKQIYEAEQQYGPYLMKNYKDAVIALELEGKVTCKPPVDERQKRKGKPTLGDKVEIEFP